MRGPVDALHGAFCFLVLASLVGAAQAADVPPAVKMWDCRYVAQPEPVIHCEPAASSAVSPAPPAPLWDPQAATREGAIDIPLFTAPRKIHADRMIGLAQSAVCADSPDCYVTWHGAPAP